MKVKNKILCFLLKHKWIFSHRSNGDIWGWNNYKCERCKKEYNTLTD